MRWLAFALCFCPALAAAQPSATGKDGYELFIQCSSLNSMINQGVCLGYLGAVVDQHHALADPPQFCVPDGEPLGAIQGAYIAAYEARAVQRGLPAAVAATRVLAAAYPCDAE